MDVKTLEEIMAAHSVVLRAIPKVLVEVYETRHITTYPHGVIKYLERFKREMLVVERIPENAGKFIFELAPNTSSTVKFYAKKYYNSIEEAVNGLLESKGEA